MSELEAWMPVELGRLREIYGTHLDLISDDGNTESFRILAEFRLNGAVYAALQTPTMRKEDEIAFYKVEEDDSNELALESIGDEEEWELVSEGYDSLLFDREGGS